MLKHKGQTETNLNPAQLTCTIAQLTCMKVTLTSNTN